MNDEDLKKLGQVIKQEVSESEKRLSSKIDDSEERVTKRIEEKIEASEERMTRKIEKKIFESQKLIFGDIGDFFDNQIFPMLEEKADKKDLENLATKDDIERIEKKLDHFSAKVVEHDKKIADLEAIPVVAHELKKKTK